MAWTKYKEILYATDGIPAENLTDFPKLVSITTDADIASELSGGGGIKFTSADGSADLSFGLYPSTNLAAGTVLARVKVTLLTAANVGDVICRLYYSSSESTTEDKAGTVSNGYALFAPLEEDPSGSSPQMRDWVTDTLLGASAGSMTSGDLITGKVGSGLDFDGSDDSVSFGDLSAAESATFTFEVAIKVASGSGVANGSKFLISEGSSSSDSPIAGIRFDNDNDAHPQAFLRDDSGSLFLRGIGTSLLDDTWHYLSAKADGSNLYLILDASVMGPESLSGIGTISLNRSTIGALGRASIASPATVSLDEIRISSGFRSDNWTAFAYADDFDNADTFSLSAEQEESGGSSVSPDDASHVHTADSPTITQTHAITPSEAVHAHTADSPTITQVHVVTPADASHDHSADSPTVTQAGDIAPDDASHAHAADSPTVTQTHAVSPSDASHGHSADSPTIVHIHVVTPADASHTHTVDSPTITQVHGITPADATHGHTADSPTVGEPTDIIPLVFVRLPARRTFVRLPARKTFVRLRRG